MVLTDSDVYFKDFIKNIVCPSLFKALSLLYFVFPNEGYGHFSGYGSFSKT